MRQSINTLNEYSPRQFTDALPDAVHTVVIGGGIVGVSVAWQLARQGVRVFLCEKGCIAGEQSSRNWGWVRQQGRDPDEIPIMMEASRMWGELDTEIGESTGFSRHGVMYLASSEAKLAKLEAWLDVAGQYQLDSRLLSAKEVEAMIDCAPGQWLGGLFTASDGRAEPWQAVPAMARAAHRQGALIREGCAARSIEQTNATVTGVITESGMLRCERVVLAAGAWSSLFAGNLGIVLPQLAVRSTVARTAPGPNVFDGNAADEELAWRRRDDGGYSLALCDFRQHYVGPSSFRYLRSFIPALLDDWSSTRISSGAPANYPDAWRTSRRWADDAISPFEKMRVLNPPADKAAVARIHERMARKLPALANLEITESWAGMIETMPDIVPVIDELNSPAGLILATGLSGHGFGIGPAVGKILAEMALGKQPVYDMRRFRFKRFSDGSKIDLGPAL